MEFYCYELQKRIVARSRPIIIITSNNEKELPDAFLRRCVFHYIKFPERETMQQIVDVHFEQLDEKLLQSALEVFYNMRQADHLKKKPSTSELIDWIKLLLVGKVPAAELENFDLSKHLPPFAGALLKNEQDMEFFGQIRYQQSR